MNNYILSETSSAQKEMSAYDALLNYRFMNLCVKAEVASLMPVTVYVGDDECNIEDVADVSLPNEYQMTIYPKNPNNLSAIIQAVYEAHPEFKMEIKSHNDSDEANQRYVLYTMPEVDKNRHDFLNEGVEGLADECRLKIDAVYAKYEAKFVEELAKLPPEVLDEAKQALDNVRKKSQDMAINLLIKKQQEIDDAYVRYQEKQEQEKVEQKDYDVAHGFKMGDSNEE